MDKKDIYEHLANIYLDASSKKKKQIASYPSAIKPLILAAAIAIIGLAVFFIISKKGAAHNSEYSLVILTDAARINFNFDPARKEIYSINLNKLALSRYSALGFSLKKANIRNDISVRVEFINSFREKSEIYIKNIPYRWKDYRINFSDFKTITDWSEMSMLNFVVEEWNVSAKKGYVYIDNIRFIR